MKFPLGILAQKHCINNFFYLFIWNVERRSFIIAWVLSNTQSNVPAPSIVSRKSLKTSLLPTSQAAILVVSQLNNVYRA